MEGADALDAVVAQLEGFEAPAGAWETEILPRGIAGYEPAWLDDLCLAGRAPGRGCARAKGRTREGSAAPVRTTPITLLRAPDTRRFGSALSGTADAAQPGPRAQAVLDYIRQNGASFFRRDQSGAGLLRTQVEEALAELVALGLVSSDSFAGLRALLVPSDRRRPAAFGRRRRRTVSFGMEDAGRWALGAARHRRDKARTWATPRSTSRAHCSAATASCSGACSTRGPVATAMARPAARLPPAEGARGDQGRPICRGFSGEQFALPDAIGLLRETRRRVGSGELVSLSGADPLNLAGILTPGPKLPALTGNRVLYRDGIPIASLVAGDTTFHETLDPETKWQAQKALLHGATPAGMVDLLAR